MLCKNCGKESTTLYCSEACKYADKYQKIKQARRQKCPECGNAILRRGIFCSNDCATRNRQKRRHQHLRTLLEEGKSIKEIAEIMHSWPKRIEGAVRRLEEAGLWTAKPEVIEEQIENIEPELPAKITLPKISLQERSYTQEDVENTRMFAACLAGYERLKQSKKE